MRKCDEEQNFRVCIKMFKKFIGIDIGLLYLQSQKTCKTKIIDTKFIIRPCVRRFFPKFSFSRVSEIAVFRKLGSQQVFRAFSELVPTRENSSRLVPTRSDPNFREKIRVRTSRKLPFFEN